jgi:phosphate starvation-inducible PhoH-like protein
VTEVSGTFEVEDERVLRKLAGPGEAHLKQMAAALDVHIGARGDAVHVRGEEERVAQALQLLDEIMPVLKKRRSISAADVGHAVRVVQAGGASLSDIFLDVVCEARGGKQVTPKGIGQMRYVRAVRSHDVTFGVGPAGTGKTYLAIASAVSALQREEVARIILTRPAVEAGERLGFLPGDLEAKVSPYLRPVYDALFDLLGLDETEELVERRVVEVAPLAFMRGRTLHDAFVILDEAQNTTREQMKMFLTRLGFGSKVVVTGDPSQNDLDPRVTSGLNDALRVLDGVEGVAMCTLDHRDVVRHPLVQSIVRAYDRAEGGP